MNAPDKVELDKTFDVMANSRRRCVLYYLTTESGRATVEDLATEIANYERSGTGTAQSYSGAAQSYTGTAKISSHSDIIASLRHVHLPKLVDADIITLGPNDQRVEMKESDELGETGNLSRFLEKAARLDNYSQITADD